MTKKRYPMKIRLKHILLSAFLLASFAAIAQTPHVTVGGNVFGGGNKANVAGSTKVLIDQNGAVVTGDVYGGGALAHVNSADGTTATANKTDSVTLKQGTVRNVYGGGLGQKNGVNGATSDIEAKVFGPVMVIIEGGTVTNNVYGCNNLNGAPQYVDTVKIIGGTVTYDVFGGGNLADNSVSPVVNIEGGTVGQDVYGGGALANVGGSTVNVLGGTVTRNVYGGGLGQKQQGDDPTTAIAAEVNGVVNVNIGALVSTDPTTGFATAVSGSATIGGSVYGCNNANGTPTNNVTVNIYNTHRESNQETSGTGYALSQVFGGGNQANYEPTSTGKKATVHIWTCDNTIQYVYGGGNAADLGTSSVNSATDVIIDGGRIEWVFGGGNGYSETNNHNDPNAANYNPGANIYGNTKVTFHAGDITYIFGGSNQYGNVSGTKTVDILADGTCTVKQIAELYGGSNEAPTEGDVSLTMGCQTSLPSNFKISSLFGGSRNADIGTATAPANVELTVNGGKYDYVFGGNNIGGTIYGNVTLNLYGGTINEAAFGGNKGGGSITGNITVNVEDKGLDCPLEVKDVFGAGDQAMYTAPTGTGAREFNPVVNINHLRTGKTISGNVYGGGNGDPDNDSQEPGMVTGNPQVVIGDLTAGHESYIAAISGNVYGGGNAAKVEGTTNVLMQKDNSTVALDIFGGGNLANVSNATYISINGGTVSQDVYGGGALANTGGSNVTLGGGTVRDIYGGGLGRNASSGITAIPAQVTGPVTVTVNSGTVHDVFGCNNINGAPTNTVQVNINNNVTHNVYGGGNLAASTVTPDVNIIAGTVSGGVFGGGNEAGVGGGDVAMTGGTVLTGIYGGCNTSGTVTGDITVSVTNGTVGTDNANYYDGIFGGGYGNGTSTTGDVTVEINGSNVVVWGDVYGGSAKGHVNDAATDNTNVTLAAGTIHGDLYGGGLGDDTYAALVNGAVQVTVNGGTVDGSVYGCNNANGAPQSTVKVDINSTDTPLSGYALANVFGGGNRAAYGGTPEVTIHNCGNSIGYVYGGGNKASVGGTSVKVYGGTIGYVFGGGNGEGVAADYTMVSGNAVAYIYGGTIDHVFSGNNSNGLINGTVTLNVNKETETGHSSCLMKIGEVYGGGNYAAGKAGTINIGCTGDLVALGTGEHYGVDQEGIRYVYGGANQAGINNNIVLNINSGIIENVFGGNNLSGTISGTIQVEIDSTGTCDWYVGNVYGGGNQAAYGTANNNYPVVNIKKGLVSGDVFGGGLGLSSDPTKGKVTGNPQVTVNAAKARVHGSVYGGGSLASTEGNPLVTLTEGALTKVFGGGKAADVDGAPTVNINGGKVSAGVYGGCDSQGNVTGNIIVNVTNGTIGTSSLLANVHGGGYGENTTTSGDVTVNFGVCNNSTTSHSEFPKLYGDIYGGSALGEVNNDASDKTTVNVLNGELIANTTTVNGFPVYLGGNVFGGGLGRNAGGGLAEAQAKVYGTVTVNIGAASSRTLDPNDDSSVGKAIIGGNVYGCNNTNGSPQDGVTVNIYRTNREDSDQIYGTTYALNNVFGGGNEANYVPASASTNKNLKVWIHSCYNSIRRVFGGSNAADAGILGNTVLVNTVIDGGHFAEVFGGGNGEVSAANIHGNVNLEIHGGIVGEFYVGSNQTGSISGTSNVTVDQSSGCEEITITEFYCGGKYANFIGDINAEITCSQGLNVTYLYGGCKEAHVFGNVHLTVKGGTYDYIFGGSKGTTPKGADIQGNVLLEVYGGTVNKAIFGGSNVKGAIGGTITVNVEDKYPDDACALNVATADVYGGGNKADYPGVPSEGSPLTGSITHTSPYNYPAVNIKNATVKNVFGGGLEAEVKGNPQVHIKQYARILGNVYGGGNMGKVIGDPKVIVNGKQQ